MPSRRHTVDVSCCQKLVHVTFYENLVGHVMYYKSERLEMFINLTESLLHYDILYVYNPVVRAIRDNNGKTY